MHIPDAYLSPLTEGVGYCVMVPLWAIAANRTAKSLQSRLVPTLAVGSAFCFAIQMFNVPAAGGTTAHALGSTLLAILVGPWAALIGVSLSLAVQALLFGDGGVLSLGVNAFNMGFVASFVGWTVYRLAGADQSESFSRKVIAASVAAYVGTVAASLSAGILLGIQPLLAHDAAGRALYFPFGLSLAIPGMVISHLIAAGPADAVVTAGALAYLSRSVPELITGQGSPKLGSYAKLTRALLWVMVATPIGLIAAGDAWGEWDLSKLKEMVGYAPKGMANAPAVAHTVLPDYGFVGAVSTPALIVGYMVSALIGGTLVAVVARALIRGAKPTSASTMTRTAAQDTLPSWMAHDTTLIVVAPGRESATWLERSLSKIRTSVERTIAAETVAHSNGFLQQIQPEAKAIGILLTLVGIGISQSTPLLCGLLVVSILLAWQSTVPILPLQVRVLGTVAFFSVPILASVALSPGIAHLGDGIAVRSLLRLWGGMSLAVTWSLTTRWTDMIRALRALRVPSTVLTSALLAYRYIFVLVETASEMMVARSARQIGGWSKAQARTYAGSASAILFAKSMNLTDEIHHAMVARGFELGNHPAPRKWQSLEFLFVLGGAVCLFVGALHAL